MTTTTLIYSNSFALEIACRSNGASSATNWKIGSARVAVSPAAFLPHFRLSKRSVCLALTGSLLLEVLSKEGRRESVSLDVGAEGSQA